MAWDKQLLLLQIWFCPRSIISVTLCCPSLPVSVGEISNKQLMLEQHYNIRPAQSGWNAYDSVIAPENTTRTKLKELYHLSRQPWNDLSTKYFISRKKCAMYKIMSTWIQISWQSFSPREKSEPSPCRNYCSLHPIAIRATWLTRKEELEMSWQWDLLQRASQKADFKFSITVHVWHWHSQM